MKKYLERLLQSERLRDMLVVGLIVFILGWLVISMPFWAIKLSKYVPVIP